MIVGGVQNRVHFGIPYREQDAPDLCVLCQSEGVACKTCQATHCQTHLLEGSCTACHSTLWNMERRRFQAATLAAGLLAIPAAGASAILIAGGGALAPLGGVALAVVSGIGLFLKKRLRPVIHNSVARKSLPPSSQRLLPAPPPEESPDATSTAPGKERPRGLRRKPASRKTHFDFKNF
ncbi:MAG: hypothetical protein GY811_28645 [Myxococcales bacterium]|nr:hypothetical protein [Myxococcales bacterium]